jgi:hypothetical protein
MRGGGGYATDDSRGALAVSLANCVLFLLVSWAWRGETKLSTQTCDLAIGFVLWKSE